MKLLPFLTAAFLAAGSAAPLAAQDADVYIVHGINGTDVGMSESLPVDVEVNGSVLLAGFTFREITDPLALAPGLYNVQISVADPANPGSNPSLIDVDVDLLAGETAAIVAHLDETGALTAGKYAIDASPAPMLRGRLTAAHTAWAPNVDLAARRFSPFDQRTYELLDVPNGAQADYDFPYGSYKIGLRGAGSSGPLLLGPIDLFLAPGQNTTIFVVGSLGNDTLEALTLTL